MKPEDAGNDLMNQILELAPLVRHKLQPWMTDGRRLTRPQALMALEHLRKSPERRMCDGGCGVSDPPHDSHIYQVDNLGDGHHEHLCSARCPCKSPARSGGKLVLGDEHGAEPLHGSRVYTDGPDPLAVDPCGECGGNYFRSCDDEGAPFRQRHIPHELSCSRNTAARAAGTAQLRRSPRPMGFFTMVPDGWYATPSRTGTNDLDFWHVKTKGDQSAHAGRRFVDRVIGGHDDVPLGNVQGRLAMEAILAAGPEESGRLFGQEIGQCRFCKRSLTRRVPRYNGQGNDCAADRGRVQVIPPADWRPEMQD